MCVFLKVTVIIVLSCFMEVSNMIHTNTDCCICEAHYKIFIRIEND